MTVPATTTRCAYPHGQLALPRRRVVDFSRRDLAERAARIAGCSHVVELADIARYCVVPDEMARRDADNALELVRLAWWGHHPGVCEWCLARHWPAEECPPLDLGLLT